MDGKKEFKYDFFKLMINSVFGKTMENIRNHEDMKHSDVMKPNLESEHPSSK